MSTYFSIRQSIPFCHLQRTGHPYEWLKDVLERLPETKLSQLHELLPQNWSAKKSNERKKDTDSKK